MFLTKLERLKLAAYLCLIADFTKSPNDDIYDGDGEKRGIRRKKARDLRRYLLGLVSRAFVPGGQIYI